MAADGLAEREVVDMWRRFLVIREV